MSEYKVVEKVNIFGGRSKYIYQVEKDGKYWETFSTKKRAVEITKAMNLSDDNMVRIIDGVTYIMKEEEETGTCVGCHFANDSDDDCNHPNSSINDCDVYDRIYKEVK